MSENEIAQAQLAYQDLQAWSESQKGAQPMRLEKGMDALGRLYQYAKLPSYAPVLSQLFSLKGEPFSIKDHFPFEPLYKRFDIPARTVLKCGRQVAKSTTLSVQGILQHAIKPYFQTIYVTPLFEQIRRLSSNYVGQFIKDSPVRGALIGTSTTGAQNVLQRTFKNGSIMHFTFAFLSAERARGISGDGLTVDEIQDINIDFLPLLQYCISASKYRTERYSGTPKTMDNTLELIWQESSQAEWTIRCGCGHWNICNVNYGLDEMITKDGLCCTKCGGRVNPRTGAWVHTTQDKTTIEEYVGYHIPQVILPMHYDIDNTDPIQRKQSRLNWRRILKSKNGTDRISYYNECLGESLDVASRMVTLTELQRVSTLPWDNELSQALDQRSRYQYCTMGVDWGGGAGGIVRRVRGILVVEGGTASFTVVTLNGFRPGSIMPEVVYSERLPTSMTTHEEVDRVLKLFQMFQCYRVGHDFGGAGNLREAMMIQAGFPQDRIFPCMYIPATGGKGIVSHHQDADTMRHYYKVDKARSLAMLCQLIKLNANQEPPLAMFPRWVFQKDALNLPEDFLALVEDKRDRPGGADVFLITRHPKKADDFCHAFNFGNISHWHSRQQYPDLAQLFEIGLTNRQVQALYPSDDSINWGLDDRDVRYS